MVKGTDVSHGNLKRAANQIRMERRKKMKRRIEAIEIRKVDNFDAYVSASASRFPGRSSRMRTVLRTREGRELCFD